MLAKLTQLYFLVPLFVCSTVLGFFILPIFSEAQITVTLKVGDRGTQVLNLQKILNSSPDTQISTSGVGSPGNETDYFGALTRIAVIKFQEKFSNEILAPTGLTNGTGVVGPKTLQKLNILANLPVTVTTKPALVSTTSVPVPILTTTPPRVVTPRPYMPSGNSIVPQISPTASVTPTNPTNTSVESVQNPGTLSVLPITEYGSYATLPSKDKSNPNFENYDTLLSSVRKVSREKGYTNTQIAQMEQAIYQSAATSTNLKELFVSSGAVKVTSKEKIPNPYHFTGLQEFFYNTVNKLAEALYPREVQAATCGGLPFGGRIFATILCTCSGAWLVATQPTGPSYVALLTHYSGRQSFAYYSAPFAMQWLGCYIPAIQECYMFAGFFCIIVPSEGATTAFLGSR